MTLVLFGIIWSCVPCTTLIGLLRSLKRSVARCAGRRQVTKEQAKKNAQWVCSSLLPNVNAVYFFPWPITSGLVPLSTAYLRNSNWHFLPLSFWQHWSPTFVFLGTANLQRAQLAKKTLKPSRPVWKMHWSCRRFFASRQNTEKMCRLRVSWHFWQSGYFSRFTFLLWLWWTIFQTLRSFSCTWDQSQWHCSRGQMANIYIFTFL